MREKLSILIAILMAFSFISFKGIRAEEADNKPFKIFVDDIEVSFDASLGYPFADSGRTFVPVRFIGNNLGFTSNWDQDTQTATISNGTTVMKLSLNSTTAEINGERKAIDPSGNIKVKVKDERIYVPLRFVSENMGVKVDYEWTEAAHIIKLYKNKEKPEPTVTEETPNLDIFQDTAVKGTEDRKFETAYKALNYARKGIAPFDKDGFLNPTTNDWPREIKGANLTSSTSADLLRRVGETPESINKRIDAVNENRLTGPNVSANWHPVALYTASKDPLLNNGSILHFGLSKKDAPYFMKNGKDSYIKIQLIDDRYLPYDKWEILDKSGKWKTLTGPITDESWVNLQQLAKVTEESKGEIGISNFYFWGGEGVNSPLKDKLRIKKQGEWKVYHDNIIPNPNIYDKIRYRATVRQGNEEHVFEFNARFQWAAGKFHMRQVTLDTASTIGPSFGSCYKRNTEEAFCAGMVEDVVQIK